MTTYIVATWGTSPRLGLLTDADFDVPVPDPDPYALVPDGTVVDRADRVLFGPNPSQDGDVICRRKNIDQQEYFRLVGNRILLWFDNSRFPGDTGWFLWPACDWARVAFRSGELLTCVGWIFEWPSLTRTPWVHAIRLYGTVGGGVLVDFDPRFPQDLGPKKLREMHYHLPDGRVRFEEWYTPRHATMAEKADRSKDVLLRRIEGQQDFSAPPKPFIPCPRPSYPAPEPEPEPEPMPTVNAIPQDVTQRSLNALWNFCQTYEYPAGVRPYEEDEAGINGRQFFVEGLIYFLMETWVPIMAQPPNPGTAERWEARRTLADAALQSYMRRRVGDVPQPGPHPSPLVGKVTLGEHGFEDEGGA